MMQLAYAWCAIDRAPACQASHMWSPTGAGGAGRAGEIVVKNHANPWKVSVGGVSQAMQPLWPTH